MQTLNQFSTLDYSNNVIMNGLNKLDKSRLVFDFSEKYNTIDLITTRMNGGAARQIQGKDGVFDVPIIGQSTPTAQILSTSTSGTNLQVNFTDPTFDKFRFKEVIGDGAANMNQGKVIGKGPGFVVLEPVPNLAGTTPILTTGTHFVAGATAFPLFPVSGDRASTAMESRYEYPKFITNRTAVMRDGLDLARRDLYTTWVEYEGGAWYLAQERKMLQNWARSIEKKAFFGRYGTVNSSIEGPTSFSMGLEQAIMDPERGGEVLPLQGPLSQAQFEGWIGRIADRRNSASYTITMLVGRGFLNQIQNFTAPYILNAGINNTFGGAGVKGIDTYSYSVNGITVNMLHCPFFNDPDVFPAYSTITGVQQFRRMQYTAVVLDTDMYSSVDNQMLPAMEKVYFGPNEIEYGYMPGIGMSSVTGNNFWKTGDLKLAVTDKDVTSLHIYSDFAYNFIAHRMGIAKLMA